MGTKLLFIGTIFKEGELFVARDDKDRYITYSTTMGGCQRELLKLYSPKTQLIQFYNKDHYINFCIYKMTYL